MRLAKASSGFMLLPVFPCAAAPGNVATTMPLVMRIRFRRDDMLHLSLLSVVLNKDEYKQEYDVVAEEERGPAKKAVETGAPSNKNQKVIKDCIVI
mmetsp:Transcript_10260/g.15669  ORF Transcript_10260/g.15669 Transcript_10260/m.15669 type:complete len:96 (+) Transcript_10260:311-598(+)